MLSSVMVIFVDGFLARSLSAELPFWEHVADFLASKW